MSKQPGTHGTRPCHPPREPPQPPANHPINRHPWGTRRRDGLDSKERRRQTNLWAVKTVCRWSAGPVPRRTIRHASAGARRRAGKWCRCREGSQGTQPCVPREWSATSPQCGGVCTKPHVDACGAGRPETTTRGVSAIADFDNVNLAPALERAENEGGGKGEGRHAVSLRACWRTRRTARRAAAVQIACRPRSDSCGKRGIPP